eukprot:scaffold59595_cov30-Tisochrysis_lutea.AAC.3
MNSTGGRCRNLPSGHRRSSSGKYFEVSNRGGAPTCGKEAGVDASGVFPEDVMQLPLRLVKVASAKSRVRLGPNAAASRIS